MENKRQKILILYAAIGLGHKTIAENIGYYLTQAGHEVRLMDAQKTQGGFLTTGGKTVYQWLINTLPGLWEWFYNSEWFTNTTLKFRTSVASKNYKEILNEVIQFQPDIIISTHTTASAIISYLKTEGLFNGKFVIAFSDFHLHRYWIYSNADYYLVNTEEQKEEMEDLGTYREKIFVCGMTIKPKSEINIAKAKNKFDIEEGDKVVLMSSGSQGFGVDEKLISKLLQQEKTKVIVLCGSNIKIFEYLEEKFVGTNARILTYNNFLDELYAITDLFISKAGALSISEALNWRLPILVSHLLPGQEAHNYNYLLEKGLVMPEPINILDSALEELQTQDFKRSISQNEQINTILNSGTKVVEAISLISQQL